MSKQHTPGPWEYRPFEHDDWGVVRGPKPDEAMVGLGRAGKFLNPDDCDAHRRLGTDPYEANARLIAAAPELLAALSDLVAICDGRLPEKRLPIEVARAAIAKATMPITKARPAAAALRPD